MKKNVRRKMFEGKNVFCLLKTWKLKKMKKQLKMNLNDTASLVVWNEVESMHQKNV